jgi:uncharacterized protein (TIGR03437 family)
VVNAATYERGALAPNTLVSIFGTNLSFTTRALSYEDAPGGVLPVELPGTGVRVLLNGLPAQMYYVSPLQVNLLIPSNLIAAKFTLQLVRDGTAGPAVEIQLREAAPALFLLEPGVAVVTRADFSLVTPDNPARPGEVVILWATGMGPVVPPLLYGQAPMQAAWIAMYSEFRVLIGDLELPADRLIYAGVAPFYGGLYQVNLRLPDALEENPEIRIAVGDSISPTGIRLPSRP